MKFRLNGSQPRLILPFLCFLALIITIMHMSSACPRGRPPRQSGEYVGEHGRIDWILYPWEGEIHDIVLVQREEGGRIANFVKSWMVTMGIS